MDWEDIAMAAVLVLGLVFAFIVIGHFTTVVMPDDCARMCNERAAKYIQGTQEAPAQCFCAEVK